MFNNLEFANLTFRMGDKVLIDLLEDVFWPIFDRELKQRRGEILGYEFTDVHIGHVNGVPTIYGRVVQKMILKARQRLEGKRLRPSDDFVHSDPSSVFYIRLTDHKFFLVREQGRSPNVAKVKSVFERLIHQRRTELYSQMRAERLKSLGRKRFSKEEAKVFEDIFYKKYPYPELYLTPIGSPLLAGASLTQFKKITHASVTLLPTNNEDGKLDSEILKGIKKKLANSSATSTGTLSISDSTSGLKKESVKKLIQTAAKTGGNSTFKVSGKTTDDAPLVVTEKDSVVAAHVNVREDNSLLAIGQRAFDELKNLVRSKAISLLRTAMPDSDLAKAEAVMRAVKRTDND